MEVLIHNIPNGGIDFVLLVLGYVLGIGTKFKQPIMLTMFLIRVLDWWIKNHPHGKQMRKETNLDEEFYRLFGVEMEKHQHLFDKRFGKDKAAEAAERALAK